MSRTVPESNPRTPVTPRRGVALALAFALLLAAGGRYRELHDAWRESLA